MMSPRMVTPSRSRLGTPRRIPRNSPASKVRVIVRIRPFLPLELLASNGNPHSCIQLSKDQYGLTDHTLHIKDPSSGRSESYELDACYDESVDIERIFSMEVEPLLPMLFTGFNATIFAYGATGSGKTHTMQGLEEEPALIPLALIKLLSVSKTTKSIIEVSYYEVYMDRCYDLLEPKVGEVSVLEDSTGRTELRGLTQVQVHSIEEFHDVFARGCAQRKIGETDVNDASSRSHGVLMVTVTTPGEDPESSLLGKLNLIDLAGNEDNRRTGNEGIRLAESGRINQSLFVLSNVINALNANEVRVPYRDSKLTRILKDSLGGTSSTLMIACLNPGSYQEAIQTLSLAARSKLIVNRFDHLKEQATLVSEKIDMAAKLRLWREANRTLVKNSPKCFSSLKTKSTFILSPSHFHPLSSQASARKLIADQKLSTSTRDSSLCAEAPSDSLKKEHLAEEIPTPLITKKTCNCAMNEEKVDPEDFKYDPSKRPPLTYTSDPVRADAVVYEGMDEKENKCVGFSTPIDMRLGSLDSTPLSERLRSLGRALREALSPVSSNTFNIGSSVDMSPKCYIPNPSKWKAIFPTPDAQQDIPCAWTPLEKFSTSTRGYQDILVKDYIEILNTGSREELLQLKGIGAKRADYILQLRETSQNPINELRDLEKIGMSARQACEIFNSNVVRQITSAKKI